MIICVAPIGAIIHVHSALLLYMAELEPYMAELELRDILPWAVVYMTHAEPHSLQGRACCDTCTHQGYWLCMYVCMYVMYLMYVMYVCM